MATNRKLSDEEKAARKAARKRASPKAQKKVAAAARAMARLNSQSIEKLIAKRSSPNRKYNWDEIREYYITAKEQMTHRQVGEMFGVPVQSVHLRAGQERWTMLRGVEQARIFRETRQKRYRDNYEEGVKFDDMSSSVAKMGMGIVASRLAQMARISRASDAAHTALIERLERGEPVTQKEMKAVGIDSYELLRLAQAATMFQDVGRKALGTDNEQIDVNVDVSGGVEHVVNIGAELGKGDKDRLSSVVEVLDRIGIIDVKEIEGSEEYEVLDAEVVGEDDEEDED